MTTLDLNTITLTEGAHSLRNDGVCLLEAAAWFAGEPHSDMPECVSGVLRDFGVKLNDVLPDDRRQDLKPLIPRLVGTVTRSDDDDVLDSIREHMVLDWLVRTCVPEWLQAAGMHNHANTLKNLAPITSERTAALAGDVIEGLVETIADNGEGANGHTVLAKSCWWPAAEVAEVLNASIDLDDLEYIAECAIRACAAGNQPAIITRLQTSAINLLTAMITPA